MATKTKKAASEELLPLIPVGYFVRLGRGRDIPKEVRGHVAVVHDAPTFMAKGGDNISPHPYQYQEEDGEFLVVTRDQYSMRVVCKRSDFESWANERHELFNFS